jgi:hypothetical protein
MVIKYDVYLSLAMHGRIGKEVLDQAEYAKMVCKKAGLTFYSPPDDENVDPNRIIDRKPSKRLMKGYIAKDDRAVDQCRVLLVLTGDRSSSGTAWEMARMHYKNRRPFVVVAPKMYAGYLMNFTTIKATHISPTIAHAIKYIKKELI